MPAYEDFDRFLQGQKQRIVVADVDAISRGGRNFSGLAAETRAGVFVWTAAALERFLPQFLAESLQYVNRQGLHAADLRYSLLAVACDSHFHTVRSAEGRAAWASRLAIMELVPAAIPVQVSGPGPIDGKTIRAYHFEMFWATFGLSGSPWPSPVHRSVIEDLADGRNNVAHGVVTSVQFGRGRTFDDCLRMLQRVDEVVTHTVLTMDEYLGNSGYRR